VATAYRERFAAVHRQSDRAREIEADALRRLSTADDHVWVVTSLVPDLAGELALDQAALSTARTELANRQPLIVPSIRAWGQISIGPRRLLADGNLNSGRAARWLAADLHTDGAGVFAAHVLNPASGPSSSGDSAPEPRSVVADSVVNGILSGLRFLARHARDRAAAGGNALVRSQLYPVSGQQPLELCQYQGGFINTLGTQAMTDMAPVPARMAPLDALADDGAGLVSAAYLLATDIFQGFGYAEATQLTRDGELRLPNWNPDWQLQLRQWADSAGIGTT
jgi:hypothetical protein